MPALLSPKYSPSAIVNRFEIALRKSWRILALVLAVMTAPFLVATSTAEATRDEPAHERIIKAYYSGWEQKNWDQVAAQLAPGFTFTSPAPDDHLPTDKFKAKCWNQAAH